MNKRIIPVSCSELNDLYNNYNICSQKNFIDNLVKDAIHNVTIGCRFGSLNIIVWRKTLYNYNVETQLLPALKTALPDCNIEYSKLESYDHGFRISIVLECKDIELRFDGDYDDNNEDKLVLTRDDLQHIYDNYRRKNASLIPLIIDVRDKVIKSASSGKSSMSFDYVIRKGQELRDTLIPLLLDAFPSVKIASDEIYRLTPYPPDSVTHKIILDWSVTPV